MAGEIVTAAEMQARIEANKAAAEAAAPEKPEDGPPFVVMRSGWGEDDAVEVLAATGDLSATKDPALFAAR